MCNMGTVTLASQRCYGDEMTERVVGLGAHGRFEACLLFTGELQLVRCIGWDLGPQSVAWADLGFWGEW